LQFHTDVLRVNAGIAAHDEQYITVGALHSMTFPVFWKCQSNDQGVKRKAALRTFNPRSQMKGQKN
jgi:hypothetical protein